MKITLKAMMAIVMLFAVSCTKTNNNEPAKATTNDETSDALQSAFSVGKEYGGGIIFFLDSSGQHGLIAAKTDYDTTVPWYNGVYYTTKARGIALGTGATNTRKIIAALGNTGIYAAKVCHDYRGGGYMDWFLPSKNELNLMYKRKVTIGGFTTGWYWCSTESDFKYAWSEYFGNGYQNLFDKKSGFFVRPVRAF